MQNSNCKPAVTLGAFRLFWCSRKCDLKLEGLQLLWVVYFIFFFVCVYFSSEFQCLFCVYINKLQTFRTRICECQDLEQME